MRTNASLRGSGGRAGPAVQVLRRPGRHGPGTGGWVLLCPSCGASVRALERDEEGWRCDCCPGARPPQGRLHVLERGAERTSRPRRLGEPRWRWEARAARGAADGPDGEAVLDAVLKALSSRRPGSSA